MATDRKLSDPIECVKDALETARELNISNLPDIEKIAEIMSTNEGLANVVAFFLTLVLGYPSFRGLWNDCALTCLRNRDQGREEFLAMQSPSRAVN